MSTVVELSLGPILVGVFVAAILYGVLSVQVFIYANRTAVKNEKWWLNNLVFIVWFVSCFALLISLHYPCDAGC